MNKKYLLIVTAVVITISLSFFIWKSLSSEGFNNFSQYKEIMDQMNKSFNESKPEELVHNNQNYKDLPNVAAQPPTKFVPPKGGSDFVLKGKDGKEYLMPMWTFMSIADNANKNAIKNQNRIDFLANVVSENNKKNQNGFNKFGNEIEKNIKSVIKYNQAKFIEMEKAVGNEIEKNIKNIIKYNQTKFIEMEKAIEKRLQEHNIRFNKLEN